MNRILPIILCVAMLFSSLSLAAQADEFQSVDLSEAERTITGVNVAIGADILLGIHVLTPDPDNTSLIAVNVAAEEFVTLTEYDEVSEGEYVYYLTVEPWKMSVDFVFDFAENFQIVEYTRLEGITLERDIRLYLDQIPETAKTMSLVSYFETLLADHPSEEFTTFVADLLE